jgi:hypothetical protein
MWCLKKRVYLFAQLLKILHPICQRYWGDALIFNCYIGSTIGAIQDWSWIEQGSASCLVEEKVLSQKEADIFERFGRELFQIKYDGDNAKLEPLAKEIFDSLFGGEDLVRVIYRLPAEDNEA